MDRLLGNKLMKILMAAFACLLLLLILSPPKASAAYEAGRLVDDAVLLDARSMDIGQIQAFLNGRGGQIASKWFVMDCDSAGQQSKQIYVSIGAPCGQSVPAASVIYYVAQIYGVNPKVILATMQKEQSLITAVNPTGRQYSQAMGYACPTSGNCNDSSNFFWQVDNGTWVLRYHFERARGNNSWWRTSTSWTCGTEKNLYKPNLYPGQNVHFYDTNGTHYTTVYVQNAATSSFYCYTPHAYNNPSGLYGRSPYGTTGLYYSGSYNFVLFYEQWFGSTRTYVIGGVDYSAVFDANFYLNANPDVKAVLGNNPAAAFDHFMNYGMYEARQASANFNVISYRNSNPDLRWSLGNNLRLYFAHFATNGQFESRIATGDAPLQPVTTYRGVDYAGIYSFSTYMAINSDLRTLHGNSDTGALLHFINYGMNEGRQANTGFSVQSYQAQYYDLRRAFGNNLKSYYLHYVTNGKTEGRAGVGSYLGGTSVLNGLDYTAVYNFNSYATSNPDVRNAFGINDIAALQHFINNGMSEGRQAGSTFNVFAYKARYTDLQTAFGNNLKSYYLHYVTNGRAEGRIGT